MKIRLRAALNVLRGRPTAYRINWVAPVGFHDITNAYVAECSVEGSQDV